MSGLLGWFALLSLLALPTGSLCAQQAPPPARAGLVVTYLANEGFVVTAGEQHVLIDALFHDGVAGYAVPSAELRERMERGTPPFRGVDLVLATHHHADHFEPAAVAHHLKIDPKALFVSTPQAVKRLQANAALSGGARERVREVLPDEGKRARVTYAGIHLDVLNLHHGRNRTIENLGFLLEMNGYKLLHVGDTVASKADFEPYGLAAESIDVAFVPFWYLIEDDGKRVVRESINAAYLVPMHIPPPGAPDRYVGYAGGRSALLKMIGNDFPNAIVLSPDAQTHVFPSRAGDPNEKPR